MTNSVVFCTTLSRSHLPLIYDNRPTVIPVATPGLMYFSASNFTLLRYVVIFPLQEKRRRLAEDLHVKSELFPESELKTSARESLGRT